MQSPAWLQRETPSHITQYVPPLPHYLTFKSIVEVLTALDGHSVSQSYLCTTQQLSISAEIYELRK